MVVPHIHLPRNAAPHSDCDESTPLDDDTISTNRMLHRMFRFDVIIWIVAVGVCIQFFGEKMKEKKEDLSFEIVLDVIWIYNFRFARLRSPLSLYCSSSVLVCAGNITARSASLLQWRNDRKRPLFVWLRIKWNGICWIHRGDWLKSNKYCYCSRFANCETSTT